MRNLKISFDWLNYKDQDEMAWAIHYLTKAGWGNFDQRRISYKEILNRFSNEINSKHQDEPAVIILLLKRMKGAKSTRDCRKTKEKQHKKSYSFVMDKSIQSKLRNLSGDRRISETLEQIINDVEQFRKKIDAEVRESIKPVKTRTNRLSDEEKSKRKINLLETIKTAQEQILKELLLEVCQKEYVIEKTSEQRILLESDRTHISEKYKKRQEDINQKIKDQLGLFKFISVIKDTNIIGDENTKNLKTQA